MMADRPLKAVGEPNHAANAYSAAEAAFDDLAIDLERLEATAQIMAASQILNEKHQHAVYALSELIGMVRKKAEGLEERFGAAYSDALGA